MSNVLIEIRVDDASGLAAAIAGGADRIALCSSLALGGLTPTPGLLRQAAQSPVPVRAMIRPREGNFSYDAAERAAMLHDIDVARAEGLSGVVIGALTPDGELDVALLEEMVARAVGMDVTLHRAVDLLPDPVAAVEIAAELGIATILTSGGARTAAAGAATIGRMRAQAGDRVEIMAGGTIRATDVAALVEETGVRAVHAAASRPRVAWAPALRLGFESELARTTDWEEVARLRAALRRPATMRPVPIAAPPAKPDPAGTLMHNEAGEAPEAAARFLARNSATIARLAARLQRDPPPFIVTCARGSSDHAATYGKYLFETKTGITVASAAPSIASLYRAPLEARGALCLAISQSGRSPDLLATAAAYKAGGALVVAMVNDEESPLAACADEVLPLCAGPERSIAATKSYITTLVAQAALAAAWASDAALQERLAALPDALSRAFALRWGAAIPPLVGARDLFVLGRGYGYAVALEAALKFKETCGLHAEAFSAAEVRHGPMAIVRRGFPVLGFASSDASGDDVRDAAALFADRGAVTLLADAGGKGVLPALACDPVLEPILQIQSFYRMVNALAIARGNDPDAPPHLRKVTETR